MKRAFLPLLLTVCLLLLLPSAAFAASEGPDEPFTVLHEALAQLAQKNTSPQTGSIGGDWTVFTLVRAGLWQAGDSQITAYYDRLVQSVDEAASKTTRKDGALHDLKSTDNARTILALSALGKDPRHVGAWDLLRPYEDFDWIKKQSYNAVAYALLALDSGGYETADPTVRTQCVDFLLQSQFEDGGWSIWGTRSDVDITAIVLQSLAPYRDDPAVAAAGERGFALLSSAQNETGGFSTIGTENTESAAQVVLACCAWGFDPAADTRLQKNGVTPIDCLLRAYRPSERGFVHTTDSTRVNVQATEQACYALLAYERLQKGLPFLFDCTDVQPQSEDPQPTEPVADITAEPTTEPTTEPIPTTARKPATQPTAKPAPATTGAPAAEPPSVPTDTSTTVPATTAPATAAAPRRTLTPHTGETSPALPAALCLLLGCAALALLRKRGIAHAP